jgi:hypothetical protein
MDVLLQSFIYVWIGIIGIIPSAFMAGLALCVLGTLITYLQRSKSN